MGIPTATAYGSPCAMVSPHIMMIVTTQHFRRDRERAGLPESKSSA